MSALFRGTRNAFRNLIRLILTVAILGASIMFVATMVALNSSVEQQIANVSQNMGTGVEIYPMRQGQPDTGGEGNQQPGQFGQTPTATATTTTTTVTITKDMVAQLGTMANVSRVEEHLTRSESGAVTLADGTALTIQLPSFPGATRTPSAQQNTNVQQRFSRVQIRGIAENSTTFATDSGQDNVSLVDGRGFQSGDFDQNVVLFSQKLAETNNLKTGDHVLIKGKDFTIIGLFSSTDTFSGASAVMLPLNTMQTLFAIDGVDSATVYASDYDHVATVSQMLKDQYSSQGYDVRSDESLYQSTNASLVTTQNSIRLGLLISVILTVIVIIFAVVMIVRERGTEIGTLKALGASHWQVIRQFWMEVFTFSMLASVLAVVLLIAMGPWISSIFTPASTTSNIGGGVIMNGGRGGMAGGAPGGGFGGFGGNGGGGALNGAFRSLESIHLASAGLNLETFLIIVGLGVALALLASLIPAWYVAQVRPAEVLRKDNL